MDCACERWHERELRARDLVLPEGHGDCLAPDTHRLAALAITVDGLDREQCRRAIGQAGPDLGEDSDRAVAEVGMLRDLQEAWVQVVTVCYTSYFRNGVLCCSRHLVDSHDDLHADVQRQAAHVVGALVVHARAQVLVGDGAAVFGVRRLGVAHARAGGVQGGGVLPVDVVDFVPARR